MGTAFELAARIREAVGDATIELTSGGSVRVGISIGCSAFPDDGETVEVLLAKADAQMYPDKALHGSSRTSLAGTAR